jgi:hypothetical protein
MRAIVFAAVAVVSLLGLGWYFADSKVSTPAVQPLARAPAVPATVIAEKPASVAKRVENEVVGKDVHRQMVYPKSPSAEKHAPMDDDLLVMEGRSEDRLSATR